PQPGSCAVAFPTFWGNLSQTGRAGRVWSEPAEARQILGGRGDHIWEGWWSSCAMRAAIRRNAYSIASKASGEHGNSQELAGNGRPGRAWDQVNPIFRAKCQCSRRVVNPRTLAKVAVREPTDYR